jgi:hypothetical protein
MRLLVIKVRHEASPRRRLSRSDYPGGGLWMPFADRRPMRRRRNDDMARAAALTANPNLRIGEIKKIAGVTSTVAIRARADFAAMGGQNPESPPMPAPIERAEGRANRSN